MQTMIPYIDYSLSTFIEIEPFVKEYYGIDRYSIRDIMMQSVDMMKLKQYMEKTTDKSCSDVDCALQIIDSIKFNIYENCKYREVVELCEKHKILPDTFAYNVLIFMSLVPDVNSNFIMGPTDDSIEDFMEYAKSVRPEMLKLYIALHNGNTEYRNSVRIAFGDCSPIKVDNMFPWLQMALDEYLNKYLGVKDLKEAEHEFNTIYKNQKVGVKLNVTEVTYMWGTYHLLQTIEKLKSSRPKSVTNKQSKFITEYLSLLNILDNKHTEARTLRVRLKYFLKTYDTLDELKQDTNYKISPNNKGGMRYF